ncbi:MAG: RNA polymerase sigma factor SigC [Okeania sp. SIO2C9]|uniref:RNA polymerase sigma factor SigC n=1 Tax=Okeania sp. SIO2C9 TaxID=2607791 RepID=UPI0013BEF743|nr:RNA polymerase sigma factor SigC [Okeania sp. SIO2C9]NEQ77019.1 RNA polymerase sigma factor SigC [Okeania sp. SIO2C9]
MSATYPYTEESEEQLQDDNLQTKISEEIEQITDRPETNELEMENGETDNAQKSTSRGTTDLVRLYLQEIGRVDLLERDQEVSEAQKVKRYVELWELLNESAKEEEGVIQCYVQLIEIRNRLTAQLGHRPSLERWAKAADIPVVELKPALTAGKLRWAELAGLTVKELEQAQSDGIKAKDHMINANLRLVVSVAKKYQNRGLELLDLIQEGTLGLERAVEKFDPRRGYRFSTYAYWWIRQGITRAIATQSRTIRLPVHITEKLNKIKKAQRKISQEKGRIAKLEDIAQELNMTPVQVREVLLKVPRSISLETKVGSDKDTELGELLETEDASPEEMLMRESLVQALKGLLEDLTQREKSVISMRYGLGDGNPYSLSEIGRSLKLSRERVRQIEAKALQKLRQPKRRSQVQDYLESLT